MKPTAMDSEQELVERARRGDPTARAALVNRHYAGVHSLAFKLTGRYETAGDVTQEVFLRAFAHLEQHDPEYSFTSWLFKIVSNHVRDLFRKDRRGDLIPEAPDPEPGPDAILENSEDVARIRGALESLPPETRVPIILHLQEGLPIREISYALETSDHAVRMKIYRGLNRVRTLLREEP
jgi:RNA polymerase sigma-70 factor (ECF subfamily)